MDCQTSKFKTSRAGATCVLAKYLECDRRETPLPDRPKRYVKNLRNDIKKKKKMAWKTLQFLP